MAVVVTYRYAYYKHNGSGQLMHTTLSDISVQSLKFPKITTVEAIQGENVLNARMRDLMSDLISTP